MKNDPWISALIGVLALLAVTFLVLDVLYILNAREARRLQPLYTNANVGRTIANGLAADVLEYGKLHPDILEFTGLKGMITAPTGAKPPGK